MPLIIRNVTQDDLQSLIKIEALCFPPSEAADDKTLSERLMAYPESFFIAIYNNEPVGFIDGAVTNSKTISDDMFEDVKCHNPKGINIRAKRNTGSAPYRRSRQTDEPHDWKCQRKRQARPYTYLQRAPYSLLWKIRL